MTERDHRIRVYMLGLSRVCVEVARDPRLLPNVPAHRRDAAWDAGRAGPRSETKDCGVRMGRGKNKSSADAAHQTLRPKRRCPRNDGMQHAGMVGREYALT